MVYLGDGWMLPSPGSEPPPPYSPPRVPYHHHQHFFPEAFTTSTPHPPHLPPHPPPPGSHHHQHSSAVVHPYGGHIPNYYEVSSSPPNRSSQQPTSLNHIVTTAITTTTTTSNGSHHPPPPDAYLDTKIIKEPPPPYPPTPFKSTHPALNHGPSSAFSPPTKNIKYSFPPPYTPKDTINGEDLKGTSGKVTLSRGFPSGVHTTNGVFSHQLTSHPPPPPDFGNTNGGGNISGGSKGGSQNTSPSRNKAPASHNNNNNTNNENNKYPQDKTRSLEHQPHRGHHRGGQSRDVSRSVSGSRNPTNGTVTGGSSSSSSQSASVNGHPKGPLLKTGKSLELPHERLNAYHRHHPHAHHYLLSSTHHPPSSSSSSSSTRQIHPHPHYTHLHPSNSHRVPPTAHVHPGHSSTRHHHPTPPLTKDVPLQETKEPLGNFSKSSKLAYVGIMPSVPTDNRRSSSSNNNKNNSSSRDRDVPHSRTEDNRYHRRPPGRLKEIPQNYPLDPRMVRNDERWARRTSRLEAAAAQSMMRARAVPVTAINGQSPSGGGFLNTNRYEMGRDGGMPVGRGRLRTCRSLDELSDLLDDDGPRLPVATTRSLDDLTEPLYENLDVINAHARNILNAARVAHNTSVPDLLEPPPRPPRQRNNSLSSLLDDLAHCGATTALSRRALNTSVPDVLERSVGGGGGGARGNGLVFMNSPSSTLRSGASTLRSNASNSSTLRSVVNQGADNTNDIGVQLQKIREVARVLGVKYRNGELSSSPGSSSGAPSTHTSPRMPNHVQTVTMQAPGVPARAPVIHDVLRDGRKASPQQQQQQQTPDNDVASQESGYSSMDSRSCRQLQHHHQQQQQQQQQLQQYQSHYLQPSFLHPSLKYSPEQLNHAQPLSLQETSRNPLHCSNGPPSSLNYYQERHSEMTASQQKQRHLQAHPHNYPKGGEYPPKTQSVSFQNQQPESNPGKPHHLTPDWNSRTLRPKTQQGGSTPSHQVPQRVVLGHQTLKGVNQDKLGIYIKSVVPGGAADQDGRLQAGDQLLTVDGKSLVGITQERAAEFMMETGPVVTLEVARQGAIYHGLATILSQPSPQANRGYPGGRHLSERDLPSKVLREHTQEPPTHPHQVPRMQSSKSVPSLNSDGGSSAVGGKASSLEVFNPSYSRTSSNTSLSQPPTSHVSHHQHPHLQQQQQQQQPPVRSRSIQNLSEGSYQGAVGRHPSNPSLVVEEERYYQNVNFHQGPQDPRMGSTRTRPAQPLPMGSPTSQGPPDQMRPDHFRGDPRGDHRPASAFMQREDMVPHRGDLQRPASQRDIRADAKMMEMTEEVRRREERLRLNGTTPNPLQQRGGPHQPHHRVPGAHPNTGPFSPEGYGSPQGFPGQQHPGYHTSSQPLHSPQGPMQGLQTPLQHHAHSTYHPEQLHIMKGKQPPPTAPKPKSQGMTQTPLSPEPPEKPSRQYGYDGVGTNYEGGPPRPPPPEDGYRDSPPPPPPPTSTHPLLQGSRPTSSVGYNSNQLPNKPAFNTSSPWDREEKDRNDRRRREAVRHWRDEQISSLEALEMRTSQQDERLRTLRLEKEFQRRAEEALTNDDDDDEDGDDDDEVDELNENDSKESSKQGTETLSREEKPQSILGQESRMNGGGHIDDERARRADEIRRKQQELEAASEAEERLLREAQRRQQEEQMRQRQQQNTPSHHLHYQHQHHASQRLDSLVATPFQSQYTNGPVNGMRGGGSHAGYPEHGLALENRNRADPVVSVAQNSPIPPERGSSYSIMQQQTPPSSAGNSRFKTNETPTATIKRVQFSETPATVETHITYDSNANQEKSPQDPNNFINEAETLLNSSPTRSIGGTPGVIGAQEVYRDPRMRRLQQKQAEQAAAKNPGPEKLTFKEKMKMFAMETGEGETPKDKVKISRAQRDIEH